MKQNEYKTVENYPEKARFTSAKFLHTLLGFHENDLLADSLTLLFLTIVGKFLNKFKEMLRSIFGFDRSRFWKTTICVHVTYIVNYIHGFIQIASEACRLGPNIDHWLIKNYARITPSNLRENERGDVTLSVRSIIQNSKPEQGTL